MSDFERYDEEFNLLIQQIESSLHEEPPNKLTTNLLQQCQDLIQQMALEARSVTGNPQLKRELLDKVKRCKDTWKALKEQCEKHGLLSGGSGYGDGLHREQDRLRQSEDMLHSQNDTLERARQTMEETEQVALEITDELGSNREKLVSAHGRVREVSGMTGRARRILLSMNQRAVQQKLMMYAVAIGLVVAFFILMWTMWR